MFQSTIIVDPKSEIKGKQGFHTYIVKPTAIERRESIKLKDVQDLLTWCAKSAFHGTHKQVVIECLQKASDAVPHALLKLLEEPPKDTQISITVDRAESVMPTIRSRCAIIAVGDLTPDQLDQLSLYRTTTPIAEMDITWQDFCTLLDVARTEWIARFVKSKKDVYALLAAWQFELADDLANQAQPNRPQMIRHLALLEEVGAAVRQNVLPRLALHHLQLRLKQLQPD